MKTETIEMIAKNECFVPSVQNLAKSALEHGFNTLPGWIKTIPTEELITLIESYPLIFSRPGILKKFPEFVKDDALSLTSADYKIYSLISAAGILATRGGLLDEESLSCAGATCILHLILTVETLRRKTGMFTLDIKNIEFNKALLSDPIIKKIKFEDRDDEDRFENVLMSFDTAQTVLRCQELKAYLPKPVADRTGIPYDRYVRSVEEDIASEQSGPFSRVMLDSIREEGSQLNKLDPKILNNLTKTISTVRSGLDSLSDEQLAELRDILYKANRSPRFQVVEERGYMVLKGDDKEENLRITEEIRKDPSKFQKYIDGGFFRPATEEEANAIQKAISGGNNEDLGEAKLDMSSFLSGSSAVKSPEKGSTFNSDGSRGAKSFNIGIASTEDEEPDSKVGSSTHLAVPATPARHSLWQRIKLAWSTLLG